MKNFIPYCRQTLDQLDIDAATRSLHQNLITRGPPVVDLENKIKDYCGSKYAVIFNSGSSALGATAYAANINYKDTVVTSPNTFVATVSAALQKTKHLKLVDIDLQTGCSNFKNFKPADDSRHIYIPVHFAGISIPIKKTLEHDVIIEDGCQALGASYSCGSKVGSCKYSDMTVFSMHPAKTICTGEGGIVTTNDPSLYERLLLYRNNGIVRIDKDYLGQYDILDLTNNYNMTSFQAALGLSQMSKIDRFIDQRKACIKRYRENFNKHPFITLLSSHYDQISAHNLCVILLKFEDLNISKSQLIQKLIDKDIGTQVHFIPLYKHTYFKKHFNFDEAQFPNMEIFYKRCLTIPLFSHLSIIQVDYICDTLSALLEPKKALL